MNRTTLSVALLVFLSGPASVLAEAPMQTVTPLDVEVVPAAVESAAGQAAAEALPAASAATTELTEQPAVAETLSEAAAPAAGQVEQPAVSEAPPAAPAAVEEAGEPAAPETPAEAVAAGAGTSAMDNPAVPCPRHGAGMMGKGMGPGGMKPGCDHRGMGQQGRHEQVVRRLDMIEARMAKIEAMLERLMRRR